MPSRKRRVPVEGRQLAVVIAIWLMKMPKWAWGKDPHYEKLKGTWRHKPDEEPDPKRMAGELIAAKIAELDWEVSYEERGNPFDGPSTRAASCSEAELVPKSDGEAAGGA